MKTVRDFELVLAGPADIEELLPLVAAYHDFEGVVTSREAREKAVTQLLADGRLGEIRLIRAYERLAGYIAICFGFSIELGGREAFIDEFYIVESERGKGLGRAVVETAIGLLATQGIVALHLEVDMGNRQAQELYMKLGFAPRDKYHLLSLALPKAQQS